MLRLPREHETDKSFYPTTKQKTILAKSIVNYFTCVKTKEDGISEFFSFYDPIVGGFIETRLKTMRSHLPISQRKRKPNSEGQEGKKGKQVPGDDFVSIYKFLVDDDGMEQVKYKVSIIFMVRNFLF